MQVLIQVVTKPDITSLRTEIIKGQNLALFGLRLALNRPGICGDLVI